MANPLDRISEALADRYRVERELGAGGMATVFLAHDLKHDRKVAIKVLKPELAAVLGAERFVQEIRTTANLQHPNILPLFDSGEADRFLYYVMPYVEGETLREKLNRETQLGVDEAVKLTTEVADALDYAHQHQVIHRDIKPENILLHAGRPLVADFGIALAVSAAAGGRMTETGLSLGTPHYMSPEQATAEKQITARSDVYSLGAVLYELLTGEPPHSGSSAQAIIRKIVTDDVRPVTELRKAVPPHVALAVAKALEKLPADRFESAARFSAALNNPSFAATATSGAAGTRGPEMRWKRVALASMAVAFLLLVGTVWTWRRGADPSAAMTASRPFTFSFALDPAQQIAVDMDQRLFDISSDGETIAWIGVPDGAERQVFYRSVRDLAVRPVPGTQGAVNIWLALSPDGRQVSFVRAGETDELWAAPLDGSSPPRRIHAGRVWSWAWADDGSFVLGEPYRGLARLSAVGAKPEVLTSLEGDEVTHQFPQVLPDGRSILFSVGQGYFHTTRIEVLTVDGGTNRRKVVLDDAYSATYVPSGHLVFGRGGQVLAVPFDLRSLSVTGPEEVLISGVQTDAAGPVTEFAVSRNGAVVYLPDQGLHDASLAWVGRGSGIEMLGTTASFLQHPRLAPDGKTVAVVARFENDRQRQIYLIDLARRVPRRITGDGVHDEAAWSPDSRELVFNSTRDGHLNLYRAPASGGVAVRLTTSPRDHHPTSWSRPGRVTFFERLPDDRTRILSLSPAEPQRVDTLVAADEGLLSVARSAVSPDGRWLAFVKAGQVFVRDASPGARASKVEEQASAAGGSYPRWRPDGRALLYASPDSRRILSVDVDATAGLRLGRETEVFAEPDGFDLRLSNGFDVGADGRILVVVRQRRATPMHVVVSMNRIGR